MTSGINPDLLIEPEMLDELMSTSWIIRIATKGPGARINLTPLWFVWVEGLVYVFCRGQKLANLRRDRLRRLWSTDAASYSGARHRRHGHTGQSDLP